jgi:threonine aldolase
MSALASSIEHQNHAVASNRGVPMETGTSVVFRGDGEPKTPQSMLRQLIDAEAESGLESDFYSLGGDVAKLETRFAELLGKEAAVFMPTGTLANHLAIRALCGGKPRAIVQEQSHLYHDSGDCVTQLSGINLVPLAKGRPGFTLDELKGIVDESTSGRVLTPVGALMIESPVRRQAGQVVPFREMTAITEYCRGMGIGTHLDGARLYMMSAATGVPVKEYAALFDTAYVSLYKYFGAPFGAILAGDSSLLDGMYHTRRMFGGGLSSSCFAASLALKGLVGFEERFHQAMRKSKDLFDKLNDFPGLEVGKFEHGSNIYPMSLPPDVDADKFAESLRRNDVFIYPEETTRLISRLTVNTSILRKSNEVIVEAFGDALNEGRTA